jgi:hypothetical protein
MTACTSTCKASPRQCDGSATSWHYTPGGLACHAAAEAGPARSRLAEGPADRCHTSRDLSLYVLANELRRAFAKDRWRRIIGPATRPEQYGRSPGSRLLPFRTVPTAAALLFERRFAELSLWEQLADALRGMGHDPVVLRGGMGAKARATALAQLQPQPGGPPLLAVATGPYAGEGFDCPALDTLFLAAPIAQKGRLVQYPAASFALTTARQPPRSTTTTTSSPASSPHHWLSAHPATPASASPTRNACHTHPVPTRRPRPDLVCSAARANSGL